MILISQKNYYISIILFLLINVLNFIKIQNQNYILQA
jgi:hypothetical protein